MLTIGHRRDSDGIIHCEGIGAGDYLLCGLAPEGVNGDEQARETAAAINCGQCIAIIEFCRRIRPGEYVTTKRGQR